MRAQNGMNLQRRLMSWGQIALLFAAALNAGYIGLTSPNAQAKTLTDTPPVASAVSATSATITWGTNLPSTSQVVYGRTTAYGASSPFYRAKVTNHKVTLTNLSVGVVYHYQCRSRSANGSSIVTPDATFTTGAGTVDTTPPTVSITAPGNGATVSGSVTVSANASDNVAVASVQFELDGANAGSPVTSAPYSYSWNTASSANGSHTLSAVAVDTSGNAATSAVVTVTVNNTTATPPTVSITSPASNATVSGTMTVNATASASAGIASVQMQVDGANVGAADTASPYSFSWTTSSVANGSHTLTAVAKDTTGNSATSAGVSVTVSNAPPAVSISSPTSGATVTGTITVSASASSSTGMASVQLQVDGSSVGSADTSSPYSFSLNTANYSNGSHALTAVAKDTAGNSATSIAANVTVSNQSGSSGTLGWTDITNQQLSGNCPPNNYGGYGYNFASNCNGVVDAWSGGIADTTRNRLWFWGGGHTDYAGNEIYYYDLNSQAVVRADNPSDPTPTCTPGYSDGTPSSSHTYGGLTYIPGADVLFFFGGGGYCPSGFSADDTWTLSLANVGSGAQKGWQNMDATLGNNGVHPCNDYYNSQAAYDPNTQLVFVNDTCQGLWTYNYSTNSYTFLASAPDNMSLYEDIVIDPSRKLLLRFGGGTAEKISIAPGSTYAVTKLTGTGCSALMNANNPGLAFDTETNLITGWPNFGSVIYSYDPDSDSCSTSTYTANAPANSSQSGSANTSNGTFGRFQYFPTLGLYALINEWNIDVHTLRLTSTGGTGTPGSTGGTGSQGSVTISNVAATNITSNSATVTWTTSPSGTSQVMYGTTSNMGSSTTENTTLSTSHSQTISGLTPNTLYYYGVQSVDSSGTSALGTGYSFGTATTSAPATPPTVSMTAPASGASLSGAVTISAAATPGSNAIASVQFLLDGASLSSAVTASPYSLSWNTTTASNGTHSLSATATDTAGNSARAATVSVTVSNAANASSDFAARCATPGVIRCISFDTAATITGNAAPGMPLIMSGLTTPTIDSTTYASGGGSLLFTVPAGPTASNTSGSYDIDFSDDFSQQIDSLINGDPASLTTACGGSPCKNEIWIQWRQRFDQGMLQHFANSEGWKQFIVGEGDTSSTLAYSCSDLETVVENSNQLEIPRMYHSCGVKLDEYDPLTVNTGKTDSSGNGIFSPQNAAGGYLNCTYTAEINIPTIPPCVPYVANQWMTFQVHIQIGTWYPGGETSSGAAPGTFKHDSTIQLYVAQEGQPSQLVIDFHPGATSAACDAQQTDIPSCQTGYDLVNPTAYGQADGNGNMIREKFGKIWLLPYQTNLNCPSCTAGHTWYDELIIGYQQIADPKF